MEDMKTRLFRHYLLAALVMTGSTLAALVIGEMALRLSGFSFELYPARVQFGWPDPITLHNRYAVDRELLWVPKDYAARLSAWKGKQLTVVFMGDSCTEFGTYDKLLQSMLLTHDPNSAFTGVNVGVGGWTTFQGLRQLQRDVVPLKPRYVTIYYGWNDHWTSFGIEDKSVGKFNLETPVLLVKLSSKLRVAQLINRAIFTFTQSGPEQGHRRPERVSPADFESNLRRMVTIARRNGITPVLLTAPSSHREGHEPKYLAERWLNDLHELVPLHRSYVQIVRRVAADEQVPLVDLAAEFDRFSREALETLFQEDGIHPTEAGDRKIAQLLYAFFEGNVQQDNPTGGR